MRCGFFSYADTIAAVNIGRRAARLLTTGVNQPDAAGEMPKDGVAMGHTLSIAASLEPSCTSLRLKSGVVDLA
jgi:hypothetical protein